MKGFFDLGTPKRKKQNKEGASGKKKGGKTSVLSCEACGLYKNCLSPKMPVTGKGRKKILVLAESQGRTEDERGIQLIGQAGQLLRGFLDKIGIDLDRDCWKLNAVACRPKDKKGNNRTPTAREISCCRPKVFKTINDLKPEKIILLGRVATESFLSHRMKFDGFSRWVGWQIPDREIGVWIFPTYHPSYILRQNGADPVLDSMFERHLRQAFEWDRGFPKGDEESRVVILKDLYKVNRFLESVLETCKGERIEFDYETSGKKPHRKGHFIDCMSIAVDSQSATAFPFFQDKEFLALIKKIMINPKIKKMAHNIKFENQWTKWILGYDVQGWYWDSMIASHVLDNRQKITGLKFQAYIRYGILDYGVEMEPFLRSVDSNSFNRIREAPEDKKLLYVGMDSMFGFRLAEDQQGEFANNKELLEAYDLFHQGILALSGVEDNGIRMDEDYYDRQKKLLARKSKWLEQRIQDSEEVKLWDEQEGTQFNMNSGPQLSKLLFDILGNEPILLTPKEKPSVKEEALEALADESPIVEDILEHRKINKIKSTYIEGFLREAVSGIIHPGFNLHLVRTARSSSQNPNWQNIPVRNKKAQKIIRSGVIPSPGNILMGVDYSGLEVCMLACNSKDRALIKYIKNPEADMHRDEAMELFLLGKQQVTKSIRYSGKNQYVFPIFYGSYWESCAPELWNTAKEEKLSDDTSLVSHLKQKGIGNFRQFEQHVKEQERKFLEEKYVGYYRWRKKILRDYRRKGYIDSLIGFKYSGLMSRNQLLNYPNQGLGFHCLLWSLILLENTAKKEKWRTKIIGQIHDEILFDVCVGELDHIKSVVRKVMCEGIRKHWEWLIVPLDIKASISEVDGNWFSMRDTEI